MPGTLANHIQQFLDYLRYEKRYSRHTLTAYATDLEHFTGFLASTYGETPLKEIRHPMVRSWLAEMKSAGFSARSINRKISGLKSFFKYFMRTGELELTPMAEVISPKAGKKLPVFLKEEETAGLAAMLAATAEDWNSLNTRMLVMLFYTTGMRLSELITLKETQVDESRSRIKVLGKGNKERVIPVNTAVMGMIREYRGLKKKEFGETGEELLVTAKGRKMYPKYAYLLVRKVLGEASTLERKSPHVLRHTFATHLMNNGADLNAVKELLGHSSLASTQVYTHTTIEKLKDIHKKSHPRS